MKDQVIKARPVVVRSIEELVIELRRVDDEVMSFLPPDVCTPRWLIHLRSWTKPMFMSNREVEVLLLGIHEARTAMGRKTP